MFGFLVASVPELTEEEYLRYRSCYCGLCLSIKERYGQIARLTLNYDMTFLIILLESLYEPQISGDKFRCAVHPKEDREWQRSIFSDYAADMTVALSYLKCLDDWHDNGSLISLSEAQALKSAYNKISALYPRQCSAMTDSLSALTQLEQSSIEDPDKAAACFGQLMGSLFIYYPDDRWSEALYSLGDSLGRLIYLMDACIDLDSDAVKNNYNPFRKYYGLDNYERFSDILKLFMADVISSFNYLPIVEDSILLKNILCSGVWQQFNKKFKKN